MIVPLTNWIATKWSRSQRNAPIARVKSAPASTNGIASPSE